MCFIGDFNELAVLYIEFTHRTQMNKSQHDSSMDDKKSLRFTEEEKVVLFSLFTKHKDVIDIRHRRNSQSQHKQIQLRKCWDNILDSFNAHPDTSKRSMKQIQKFWLNSK